jgi:hypothetical protein
MMAPCVLFIDIVDMYPAWSFGADGEPKRGMRAYIWLDIFSSVLKSGLENPSIIDVGDSALGNARCSR